MRTDVKEIEDLIFGSELIEYHYNNFNLNILKNSIEIVSEQFDSHKISIFYALNKGDVELAIHKIKELVYFNHLI